MSLTQGIADSLGVADEGLRLILGQISGNFLCHTYLLPPCILFDTKKLLTDTLVILFCTHQDFLMNT